MTCTYTITAWPTRLDASSALAEYIRVRSAGQYAILEGAGLNFSGADLHGVNLSEAYLAVADLDGVNLNNVDLNRATLTGSTLRNVNLSGAYLHKVEADECEATSADLSTANLFRASFVKADLRYASLRECQLSSTNFRQADLRNANLQRCRFGPSPTRLSESQLFGADITDATGEIRGPIHVTGEEILAGAELEEWFAAHGAPNVRVVELSSFSIEQDKASSPDPTQKPR